MLLPPSRRHRCRYAYCVFLLCEQAPLPCALRALLLCTRRAVSSEWYYCHAGSNLKRRRRRRRTTLWLRPSSSSYERRKEFGGGLHIQQPLCFFLLLTGVGEGPEVEDVMMIMMIWIISSSLTQCNATNDIKCLSQLLYG